MGREELLGSINELVMRLVEAKGITPVRVTESTAILDELPLDSLDMATLLVHLERITGSDPFADVLPSFRTIGDLANYYL